jgi:hypothetical protein
MVYYNIGERTMTIVTESPIDPHSTNPWYKRPLDTRAPFGGEVGINGHKYKGGEFMPFYVPRPVMPQIEHHDLNRLIRFVRESGIWVLRHVFAPKDLHNHQRINWDPKKVDHQKANTPVIIAQDHFILDGNHRWYGHKIAGTMVSAIQIGLPFEPAVALLFKFPKTTAGQS